MANTQNLIVPSSSVARENGRKGGKKKAENYQKRKALKEELEILLQSLSDNETTYQKAISISLIKQAMQGNTKAYEVIRDTLGEKYTDKVQLEQDKPFEVNITVRKN